MLLGNTAGLVDQGDALGLPQVTDAIALGKVLRRPGLSPLGQQRFNVSI